MSDIFTRQQCANEPEWLDQRKLGIGGSSCASILGLNPYMTNTEYWEIKVGLKEAKDISQNHNVRYGTLAEEHIREMFKLDYEGIFQVYHSSYELLIRNDKPFIRVSLDGEIIVLQDCTFCGKHLKKGMRGILEIKTTEPKRSYSLESWKDDNVPMNYHCQRLQCLVATDYDFHILICDFRAYFEEADYWKHWSKSYCILKEEVQDQLDYLEKEETKFWKENVEKKVRPSLKF